MKILITIPHYYKLSNNGHGSGSNRPDRRIKALTACLFNIYSLFSKSQKIIDIHKKSAFSVLQDSTFDIDVIICTANNQTLLNHINLPPTFFKHRSTLLEDPKFLDFECQKALKENLGKYDYYCFMEDDLIINDALFFEKLIWFNSLFGIKSLLQPNRYESSINGQVLKAYVDGNIRPEVTSVYQNRDENKTLTTDVLGKEVIFERPYNPHSGCYFLTQSQLEYWANQPYFLDYDVSFISPLESSATLGIMKTFNIYKSSLNNVNFFEIQHFGDQFLKLIGKNVILTIEA